MLDTKPKPTLILNVDDEEESEEVTKKKRRCIISQQNKLKFRWDVFIIFLAIYNSFSIPYAIAFRPPAFETTFMTIFNLMIDMLFMCDIAVGMRTTYLDPSSGDEEWDPKLIAKRYMFGGRFLIDFLSSIPMDLFGSGESAEFLSAFGMLKLVRITRIGRII